KLPFLPRPIASPRHTGVSALTLERQRDEDGGNTMLRIQTGARTGRRWGVFSAASIVAFLALSSSRAAAAPYSGLVVVAHSGVVLHSTNPDAKRHPASLTKIM